MMHAMRREKQEEWLQERFSNVQAGTSSRRARLAWLVFVAAMAALTGLVGGFAPAAAIAQSPIAAPDPSTLYQRRAGSPDGIGKWYMGRELSQVMGWQGAEWLERAEREREERTDLLLPMLGLKPGMVVADVGAGSGYFARRLAAAVGSRGRVFAVDVQPEMVRMLEALAKRPGLGNIQPVLSSATDVKLTPASIDLALMVDVYHELEHPYEVLASMVRAVKPGGLVVFVEYRAEDDRVPIKALHKMSEAQVKAEAARHALVWERTLPGLPWQHVIVFRRR